MILTIGTDNNCNTDYNDGECVIATAHELYSTLKKGRIPDIVAVLLPNLKLNGIFVNRGGSPKDNF
jgi:hypothetical protein